MRRRLLFLGVAVGVVAAALGQAAAAQVATSITPDTAAAFATGTSVVKVGAVTTIDGGARTGGNLFHSFTTFNLASGETARWTAVSASGVANVINRVTGGSFSTIAGTIDTTALPNADFYFINPAGVLFTASARLDVPKAAYISTAADGLSFADGAKFSTLAGRSSTFTMSAPQSFGFLGNQQPIIIDAVTDFLPSGVVDLSLFASDVAVRNSAFTPHTFTLTTTGQWTGSLSLADPYNTAPQLGQTILNHAQIAATATGKGRPSVRVATGAFAQLGGVLVSSTFFRGDAGDLWLAAQTADISGGARLASDSDGSVVQGDAGTVRLNVGSLHVGSQSAVSSSTFSVGAAGDVIIKAGAILVDGEGDIGSDSHSGATGRAGGVQISANTVTVTSSGRISSDTFSPGVAGMVQINANTVTVTDSGTISSSTEGAGDAGAVQVIAGTVTVDNGSIDSASFGEGRGGLVSVQADQVTVTNQGFLESLTSGPADAGAVHVKAGTLTLTNQGVVSSNSLGDGAAGDVAISATNLKATDSFISTNSAGIGRAGVMTVAATTINLNNSTITSETNGSGAGGDVTVNAGSVSVTSNSEIATDTFGSGAAGRVNITADKLSVDFASVLSGAAPGSTGAAGSIVLNLGQLQLVNQSVIDSDTFGLGDAGSVSVTAKGVSLTGDSAIESVAREGSFGAAGQVSIHSTALTMDFSLISSSTFARGDAGGVLVSASSISLANQSSIESGAGPGSTGRGGQVAIAADNLSVRSASGILTSTVSSGDAGQLQITAATISVDEAQLASRAQNGATGAAGSLTIQGATLSVTNGGQVETASANPKTAGEISIAMSGGVTVAGEGSVISSANTSASPGAAGSIGISGAPILLADGGSITTNSVAGAAGDITLTLPRNAYVLLEGRSDPGVITTSSGPGTGGRITITDPLAIISNGARILALGQARGANVQLKSDFFIRSADRVNLLSVDGVLVVDSQVSDVSAGVAIPDVAFLDASKVLRGQCPAARSSGVTSQLSLRAFGPYGGARTAEAGAAPAPTCGAGDPPRHVASRHRLAARSDPRL